ncbi:uncharacterized protein LOC135923964 [Gordionus sp. m RMFG-2023]|uniref:uncharacterized protein LOC135923964 n=1 Tax=Gordionus sp. m RMFG-2023 TaxID=3053472 RepID=UPI0031FC2559
MILQMTKLLYNSFVLFLTYWVLATSVNAQLPVVAPNVIRKFLSGNKSIVTDIILIMETVVSPNANYTCAKKALIILAKLINRSLNISANRTHVGIVKYEETATVVLKLRAGNKINIVTARLNTIVSTGGIPRLDRALALARNMLMKAGRPGSQKKILIFTSTPSDQDPIPIAKAIKALGIKKNSYII